MNKSSNTKTNILSLIIATLAIAASAGGLLLPEFYNDNDFVKTAWFTNDIVTLTIAVPLLITAMVKSQMGSTYWRLIWIGVLGYMFYNYAFYLFGSAFNKFFLIYTGLFSLSGFLLLYMLWKTKTETVATFFNNQTPVKWISAYLFLMPLILFMVELSMILPFLISEKIPESIIITGHPTGVVFALDFSIVIPAFIAAALLLWKRKGWGYILALMMLVKGFTYGLVLCVSTTLLALSDTYGKWDPLMPLYLVLTTGGVTGCWLLYRHSNEQ
jgi:hypothetical protein